MTLSIRKTGFLLLTITLKYTHTLSEQAQNFYKVSRMLLHTHWPPVTFLRKTVINYVSSDRNRHENIATTFKFMNICHEKEARYRVCKDVVFMIKCICFNCCWPSSLFFPLLFIYFLFIYLFIYLFIF